MGYELEAPPPPLAAALEADERDRALERHWRRANERLAAALAAYRALQGRVATDDPSWLAAQLRLAQARQRCREAGDDLERRAHEPRPASRRR